MHRKFVVPETTIYRPVEDELVVIEIESGKVFYFNPATKEVLDFFKTPSTLGNFLESEFWTDTEVEYLNGFMDQLVSEGIARPSDSMLPESGRERSAPYSRPIFIRKGEKTLDEISLLD